MPSPASAAPDLPDDIAALKDLVLTHAARERHLEQELALVRERLNLLLAKRYGRSSEPISPDQLALFNEAEAESDAAPECAAPQPPDAIPVAAKCCLHGGTGAAQRRLSGRELKSRVAAEAADPPVARIG